MLGLITDLVNVVQVALTVVFLLFTARLLRTWWPALQDALSLPAEQWRPENYLVVAIAISFLGAFADNTYWGVTWLSDLYDHPYKPYLFEWGPLANVFFRQIPGIVSVYMHLKGAMFWNFQDEMSLYARSKKYTLAGVSVGLIVLLTIPRAEL